jgi:hypothetical protein
VNKPGLCITCLQKSVTCFYPESRQIVTKAHEFARGLGGELKMPTCHGSMRGSNELSVGAW